MLFRSQFVEDIQNKFKPISIKIQENTRKLGEPEKRALDHSEKQTEEFKEQNKNLAKMNSAWVDNQRRINKSEKSTAELSDHLFAAVGMMDELANLTGKFDEGLAQTISTMADVANGAANLAAGIASSNPFQAIAGGIQIVSAGMDLLGGNNELSQSVIDRYDALIEAIDDVISKQREMLNSMAGQEAVQQAKESVALIEKQIAATKKLGKEYLDSGSSWKSHSKGYHDAKDLKRYREELKKLGIDFEDLGGRAKGLFDLTADQLKRIKEEIPELWADMNDETVRYLQQIIDSSEELDDLKKKLNESLTGISFDSARDSLRSLLLDADTTMKDVSENFQDYMKNAIVGIIIDSTLKKKISEWYEAFADAMSDDVLTEDEKNALQEAYNTIYKDAANMRDAAYDAAGIDPNTGSKAEGKAGAIRSEVTEETASELVGLWNRTSLDIRDQLNEQRSAAESLINIEAYTLRTAESLERIEDKFDDSNKTTRRDEGY